MCICFVYIYMHIYIYTKHIHIYICHGANVHVFSCICYCHLSETWQHKLQSTLWPLHGSRLPKLLECRLQLRISLLASLDGSAGITHNGHCAQRFDRLIIWANLGFMFTTHTFDKQHPNAVAHAHYYRATQPLHVCSTCM